MAAPRKPDPDVIAALNIKLSSISASNHGPSVRPLSAPPTSAASLLQAEKSEEDILDASADACPTVDIKNIPERDVPIRIDCLIVEKDGWPGYLPFEQGSWALHGAYLDRHNCKPGIRVILAKAETHGPKTTPYTVYIMHVKTAFTVRGLARRYSEFKDLDRQLRSLFANAPSLPKKKTFGKMSPKFVSERKRQLQNYIEQARDPSPPAISAHVPTPRRTRAPPPPTSRHPCHSAAAAPAPHASPLSSPPASPRHLPHTRR